MSLSLKLYLPRRNRIVCTILNSPALIESAKVESYKSEEYDGGAILKQYIGFNSIFKMTHLKFSSIEEIPHIKVLQWSYRSTTSFITQLHEYIIAHTYCSSYSMHTRSSLPSSEQRRRHVNTWRQRLLLVIKFVTFKCYGHNCTINANMCLGYYHIFKRKIRSFWYSCMIWRWKLTQAFRGI